MFIPKAHIIIIDGQHNIGKKMLAFELSLALLYNAQRTALLLSSDSPLHQTLQKRHTLLPQLLSPAIIKPQNFYEEADKYNAIIIPNTNINDDITLTASTYISLIAQNTNSVQNFIKDRVYLNSLWELKKKIAAARGHSLNWIVCENNQTEKLFLQPTPILEKASRTYGFKPAAPLNLRTAYKNNCTGISAQDKTLPLLNKSLTYDDICAKREITKLAEFIFNA